MKIPLNDYLGRLSLGDTKIIEQVYSDVFPKVDFFIKKNNGNKSDAEDIFQKALLQLIARYQATQFQLKDSFDSYLFTVCRNLWKRELNKRKREVTNDEVIELITDEQEMLAAILDQEKWDLFHEKMSELSDNCMKVLKLFFKETPYAEIAKQMEYSSENVLRQRIFKCKKKLTDLIKGDSRYNFLK